MSRSSTSAFLFLSVRMESTEKCDVVIQNFNGKFLKTPPGMTGRCLSPTQMLYTSKPWALLKHELSFSRDLDAYIHVDTLSKQQACCSQMSDYFHSIPSAKNLSKFLWLKPVVLYVLMKNELEVTIRVSLLEGQQYCLVLPVQRVVLSHTYYNPVDSLLGWGCCQRCFHIK